MSRQAGFIGSLFVCIGTLSAVESLVATRQDFTAFLNWTAPPNFGEDITFCVGVTSQSSFHSECMINVSQFVYPNNGCHAINFTVTPVNGAGKGENATISYIGAESGKF